MTLTAGEDLFFSFLLLWQWCNRFTVVLCCRDVSPFSLLNKDLGLFFSRLFGEERQRHVSTWLCLPKASQTTGTAKWKQQQQPVKPRHTVQCLSNVTPHQPQPAYWCHCNFQPLLCLWWQKHADNKSFKLKQSHGGIRDTSVGMSNLTDSKGVFVCTAWLTRSPYYYNTHTSSDSEDKWHAQKLSKTGIQLITQNTHVWNHDCQTNGNLLKTQNYYEIQKNLEETRTKTKH